MNNIAIVICIASELGQEDIVIIKTHPNANDILLTVAGDER